MKEKGAEAQSRIQDIIGVSGSSAPAFVYSAPARFVSTTTRAKSGQGAEFTEIWYLRRANINYSLRIELKDASGKSWPKKACHVYRMIKTKKPDQIPTRSCSTLRFDDAACPDHE